MARPARAAEALNGTAARATKPPMKMHPRLSFRRHLAACLILVLPLAVVACSGDGSTSTQTSGAAGDATSGSGGGGAGGSGTAGTGTGGATGGSGGATTGTGGGDPLAPEPPAGSTKCGDGTFTQADAAAVCESE